jgi:hypothetical protein
VRGSGVAPTTAANSFDGVKGFVKALCVAGFLAAAFFGAAFFTGAFLTAAAFFGAAFTGAAFLAGAFLGALTIRFPPNSSRARHRAEE